ncbi:MAG: hypothetical protein HQK89_05430 [Nitrospirae bacterium]|nr:hypothetical protein [Nitrospirota bacterium]
MQRGIVYTLLNKIYEYKKISQSDDDTRKRIIRLQLTLRTGLSMSKFTISSTDSPKELKRIVGVLQTPDFGLYGFPFEEYLAEIIIPEQRRENGNEK